MSTPADIARAPISVIQAAVCAGFAIPLSEMYSRRRGRRVARPRQVAMYLARELTALSLPAIGRHFGGRDHTTVMHAIKRVEELARADADFGARVEELRRSVSAPVRESEPKQNARRAGVE